MQMHSPWETRRFLLLSLPAARAAHAEQGLETTPGLCFATFILVTVCLHFKGLYKKVFSLKWWRQSGSWSSLCQQAAEGGLTLRRVSVVVGGRSLAPLGYLSLPEGWEDIPA